VNEVAFVIVLIFKQEIGHRMTISAYSAPRCS